MASKPARRVPASRDERDRRPYRVEAPGKLPFKTVVPGERFFRYAYGQIVIDYSVFEQFDLVVVHRVKTTLAL